MSPSPVQPGSSRLAADSQQSLGILKGAVETGSSGVILMPDGDTVYVPASFIEAEALLRKLLAEDDYTFFMDTLIVCAVDVITDSWTLGKESITLEDHAILGTICATFDIDMHGMHERSERRERKQHGH